jgi:hypothetical protein
VQGASPEEVQQKLYQKAVRGTVTDDPQGFATMYPSQYPDLLDISSTPNRLLQANLTGQVSPKLMITAQGVMSKLDHLLQDGTCWQQSCC